MQVVVLGAGIAGLAAATELLARAPHAEVRVLEARARPGGLMHTEHKHGLLLEHGPDSFASSKAEGMELVRQLGLEPEIVTGAGTPRTAYVARGARLLPLPPALMAFRKSAALDLMRSPLLSLRGKLRVLSEPLRPRRVDPEEESLAAFVTRRFGSELLRTVFEPLVGSVYGSEPERMSASAVLPNLVGLEQQHGSIGMALLRAEPRPPAELPYLVSLARGMESLPRALSQRLADRIVLGQRARRIERDRAGFRVHTHDGGSLRAERLIVALPAYAAAALLEPLAAELASVLAEIEYNSLASLHFAFRSEQIGHAMHGTGFVVPRNEQRAISACTWASRKWPGRAPQGVTLLRCFVRHTEGSDQELSAAALQDLRALLGVEGAPLLAQLSRLERALPRYTLGHQARVRHVERLLMSLPGLGLCGNALRGMGVPECIASGRRAARAVLGASTGDSALPVGAAHSSLAT